MRIFLRLLTQLYRKFAIPKRVRIALFRLSATDKPVTVYLDGNKLEFDVNLIIDNGRTLVPARAVSEGLKAEVDWDDELRKVIITSRKNIKEAEKTKRARPFSH